MRKRMEKSSFSLLTAALLAGLLAFVSPIKRSPRPERRIRTRQYGVFYALTQATRKCCSRRYARYAREHDARTGQHRFVLLSRVLH
jgi:hypothetical protein